HSLSFADLDCSYIFLHRCFARIYRPRILFFTLHYLFDETRRDEPAKDGLLNRLVFVFIRVPEMCANSRERFRIFSSRAGNATEERVRILLRPVPSNKKSALVALAVNSYRNAVVLTLKSARRLVDSEA